MPISTGRELSRPFCFVYFVYRHTGCTVYPYRSATFGTDSPYAQHREKRERPSKTGITSSGEHPAVTATVERLSAAAFTANPTWQVSTTMERTPARSANASSTLNSTLTVPESYVVTPYLHHQKHICRRNRWKCPSSRRRLYITRQSAPFP